MAEQMCLFIGGPLDGHRKQLDPLMNWHYRAPFPSAIEPFQAPPSVTLSNAVSISNYYRVAVTYNTYVYVSDTLSLAPPDVVNTLIRQYPQERPL